ncbi:MAG: hypothetical protein K8R36_15230 [Planctomycetales bacterium]|nr:hypothetical protein [Planctomycetales bacterium]
MSLFSVGAGIFGLTAHRSNPGKSFWSPLASDGNGHPPAIDSEPALRSYFKDLKAGRPFDLQEATSQVFRGTVHSDQRRIQYSENWVQWLAGQGYAPLLHTQDTDLLINGGVANCGERAQILKTLAEAAGRKCRFVGLNGHVVLEVEDEGIWQLADPDYGIAYTSGVELLSKPTAASLVRETLHESGYKGVKVEQYLYILQSSDDNSFLPPGQALSPRLFALEAACWWLAWFLPPLAFLASLATGCLAWRRVSAALQRRRPSSLWKAEKGSSLPPFAVFTERGKF